MTAYHWWKLPELIRNSRVQAEVKPAFTLKNCKHSKKQIASIFYFSDEITNREMVQKVWELAYFLKYNREVVKWSENREIPDLWGRFDKYAGPENRLFFEP